ncbi:hypothetical protein BDB00DRAFT_177321 [Zychaea mexicana]|uniref:uncharacterized protein n=1 Tax=Zychaea mexicana TaxID=64656 RepID=UPI0022FE1D34|nr:uncharacterized protein BDB00DRAFT_177321 [Zychaea mexicana]KAI9495920.1 hypothetical protein BDB00DRAFT_177321 [Zychaea mexicana]
MTSICVNMSQAPNEISARLATALQLGYPQQLQKKQIADSTMSASVVKAALDYDRLDVLSPFSDQKQQQHQQSTKEHVDFICLLPYEIVSSILELLTTDELLEYMDVSRGWREHITSIPTLWHQLSITHGDYDVITKLTFIGTYIRKYTIHNGNDKAINGSLERMRSGSLNNIQSLSKSLEKRILCFYTCPSLKNFIFLQDLLTLSSV